MRNAGRLPQLVPDQTLKLKQLTVLTLAETDKAEEAAIAALKRALGALSVHLASNTYLVSHAVTLTDIIMTCNLFPGFTNVMTKSFTAEFPHVERYYWTMVNQPNFKKVIGEVKQAEIITPKEEPKKEAEKEPAKPKAEDVEEEEEAPKPKAKNPLDLLPPSKMILDEWKRLYSNTKTNFREVAIKVFQYKVCNRRADPGTLVIVQPSPLVTTSAELGVNNRGISARRGRTSEKAINRSLRKSTDMKNRGKSNHKQLKNKGVLFSNGLQNGAIFRAAAAAISLSVPQSSESRRRRCCMLT
ncbi:unnamed protein product [Camellia sinensis]